MGLHLSMAVIKLFIYSLEASSNVGIQGCLGDGGVRAFFVKFELLVYVLGKKGALYITGKWHKDCGSTESVTIKGERQ